MEKIIEEMKEQIEFANLLAEKHKGSSIGDFQDGRMAALIEIRDKLKNFFSLNSCVSGSLLLVQDEDFWNWVYLNFERYLKRWERIGRPEEGNWNTTELYEKYLKERQQ